MPRKSMEQQSPLFCTDLVPELWRHTTDQATRKALMLVCRGWTRMLREEVSSLMVYSVLQDVDALTTPLTYNRDKIKELKMPLYGTFLPPSWAFPALRKLDFMIGYDRSIYNKALQRFPTVDTLIVRGPSLLPTPYLINIRFLRIMGGDQCTLSKLIKYMPSLEVLELHNTPLNLTLTQLAGLLRQLPKSMTKIALHHWYYGSGVMVEKLYAVCVFWEVPPGMVELGTMPRNANVPDGYFVVREPFWVTSRKRKLSLLNTF